MAPQVPEVMQASSSEEIVQLQTDAIFALGKRMGRPLEMLEAGCGQRWLIDLDGLEYKLTGIDLDPAALELRRTKTCDLDVAICGDLSTLELPEASFDVVYSSFVLEHVEQADRALQNFVKWLRPDGLLILRLPDPGSVRGFLTQALPHWAHVWYHRYFCGIKLAGKPGYAPYPTFYHPVIRRERLCSFLAEQDARCLACYGDGFRRDGSNALIRMIYSGVSRLIAILSLGRLTSGHADILYIAVKKSHALA